MMCRDVLLKTLFCFVSFMGHIQDVNLIFGEVMILYFCHSVIFQRYRVCSTLQLHNYSLEYWGWDCVHRQLLRVAWDNSDILCCV